jgi:hypothetical protein
MLRLAGKYGNICFFPRVSMPEAYEEGKQKVLRVAERFHRTDQIGFMAGAMGPTPYNHKEYCTRVEAAIEMGASYFQTSFPRNESLVTSVRRFAQEIIPSFS